MTPEPEADPSSRRRWGLWIGVGIVVLLAIGVGGPYAYIHLGTSDAPAPLALPNTATSTTVAGQTATTAAGATGGASSSDVTGTWTIADGSTAGYRINETLVGQSAEAVGRTTAVTGTVTIASTQVTAAKITVDLTKVTSDKSQRDGQFQGRIMDTASFPNATFSLTGPIELGAVPADGATVAAKATGDLTIHGVTKPVTLDLSAQRSGSTIKVSGNTTITFADYDINNPSGGPATVGDSGQLEFLLVLAR